jgi:hypothetical protein
MQTAPDRPGPSLRRLLTLYFTTRPPASLLVDAVLALLFSSILYHAWASFPRSYFQPQYGDDQHWLQNFISPVTWLGSLVSLIRAVAWITVGVAGLRFLVETLRTALTAGRAPTDGDHE